MLTGDLARPTLREPETVLEHQDRGSPARRAQKFPFAISRNATFSSSLSATICFSVVFLPLELLQPLGVVDLHPAVLRTPTVIRRL
jgi:hypothetical protein